MSYHLRLWTIVFFLSLILTLITPCLINPLFPVSKERTLSLSPLFSIVTLTRVFTFHYFLQFCSNLSLWNWGKLVQDILEKKTEKEKNKVAANSEGFCRCVAYRIIFFSIYYLYISKYFAVRLNFILYLL